MGKIISIYGQDGNGKTTLSYALANQLGDKSSLTLIIHTDFNKPVLNERMPEIQNTVSLGRILMTGDYYNIEKTFIPYLLNKNVFVAGLINNENFSSYSKYSPEAAKKYIKMVSDVFDYVVIDSTDDINDTLALHGLEASSHIIELLSPNIHGVVFEQAYNQIFEKLNTKGKTVYTASKVLDYNDPELIEERLKIRFSVKLPFSGEVDYKSMAGSLIKGCTKKEGAYYEKGVAQLKQMVG
jgi:MinD-like ATPase involved in chromosome partitioning or flagellar assembly